MVQSVYESYDSPKNDLNSTRAEITYRMRVTMDRMRTELEQSFQKSVRSCIASHLQQALGEFQNPVVSNFPSPDTSSYYPTNFLISPSSSPSFQSIPPLPEYSPPFPPPPAAPPFITNTTQSTTPYYPPMYPQNYYPEPSYNPYYQPQYSYTDNPYYQGPITNSSYTPTYCPEYYHYSGPTNSSNQFSSSYYAPGINQTPTTNGIPLVHELLELESPMDQFKEDNQEESMEEYVSDFYYPTSSPMTALDGQIHEAQLLFDEMPQRDVDNCEEHLGPKKSDVLQGGEDEFEQTIGGVHSPATTERSTKDPQFRTSPISYLLSLAPPQDTLPLEYSTIVSGHRKSMDFFNVEIINVLYTQNLFDVIPQPLVCYHSKPISDLSPHVPYNRYFSLNFPPPRPPSQPPDAFPVREISLMPRHKHAIKLLNQYTLGNSVPSAVVLAGGLTECSEKFELEMDYRVFRQLLDSYVKAKVLVSVYLSIALRSGWQSLKSESTAISVFMRWNCDWAKINSMLVCIYASRESESVGNIFDCHVCGSKLLCDICNSSKEMLYDFNGLLNSLSSESTKGTSKFSRVKLDISLVSVPTACARLGKLERGQWVNLYLKTTGMEPEVFLSTALLTMYAKCGAMNLARYAFDAMPEKKIVSWNSMIMGYGMHRHGEKAIGMFLHSDATSHKWALGAFAEFLDNSLDKGEDGMSPTQSMGMLSYTFLGSTGNEDIDVAIRYYLVAIEPRPNFADAWSNLASAYIRKGRLSETAQCYRQALARNPCLVDAHSNLGNLMKSQSLVQEAYNCYLEALQIQPDFAIAWSNLAGLLMEADYLNRALHYYKEAVKIRPTLSEAYLNLGNVYKALGMRQETIVGYQRDVQTQPDYAMDMAIVYYKPATVCDARFWEAYNNLGNDQMKKLGLEPNRGIFLICAYSLARMVDEGKRLFSSMMDDYQILPGLEHYSAMIGLVGRSGRLEEAIDFIEEYKLEISFIHYVYMYSGCSQWSYMCVCVSVIVNLHSSSWSWWIIMKASLFKDFQGAMQLWCKQGSILYVF